VLLKFHICEVSMRKSYLYCLGLFTLLLVVGKVGQAQDSLGMHHVATLDYWQGASDIQMVGNLAYVVSSSSGLHIVDLTDPANPQEIGRATWYDWGFLSGGVYVIGNRAYVATTYGCCAFDISDPTHPIQLARWWEDRSLCDIFVNDTIAIIQIEQEYGSIPVVADISDLENVQQIGDFGDRIMWPLGMAGNYLYVANSEGGVLVFDLSIPSQPVQVAQVDTTMPGGLGTIAGDYAYFGTLYDGVRIIDVSNPLQPVEVASCDTGWCCNLTVINSHLVISRDDGCIDVWNVVDPVHPVIEGELSSMPEFMEISGSGNLICLGYYYNIMAVAVVDISNPAAPVQVSSFGANGTLLNLTIGGTVAYAGGGWVSLRTISLADPLHPLNLGAVGEQSGDIAVRGNYAYMTDRNSGLVVFDVSNPAEPEYVHCTPGGYLQKIVIPANYAYVIGTDQGWPAYLYTYSLADPTAPVQVNSLSVPYPTMGDAFEAQNDYLYIAAGGYLFVYSLSAPGTPQLVGSCPCGGEPFDMAVAGSYAYVADYTSGLATIDITRPESPAMVGLMGGTTICKVAAVGDTIITDGSSRINMWDMTDPTEPRTIGYYPTLEIIRDIRILGSHVITISSSELRVYQCDPLSVMSPSPKIIPNEITLYPCYPNPFNSSMVIRFFLPFTTRANLTIYDVTGRHVKVLIDEIINAGEHSVTFDGSGLSSGVYFVRLQSENHTQTEKMVLLK
jgi:hypothetical protein